MEGKKEGSWSQAGSCKPCLFLALLPGGLGANHLLCHESPLSRGKKGQFLPTFQGNCESNGTVSDETLQAESCKDFCSQTGGCSPQPIIIQPPFSMCRYLQSITQRTRQCQGIHRGSFFEMCSNYFSLIITPTVLIIMSGSGLPLRVSIYGLCFILDGCGFILSGYMFHFSWTCWHILCTSWFREVFSVMLLTGGWGVCCTGCMWQQLDTHFHIELLMKTPITHFWHWISSQFSYQDWWGRSPGPIDSVKRITFTTLPHLFIVLLQMF